MELEDYFDFDPSGRILVRGTEVAVECLLDPWLGGYDTADILHQYHPRVTVEQIYATITYYLHQKAKMDAYLERCRGQATLPGVDSQLQGAITSAPIRALRAHGLRGYLQTLDQGHTNP